MFRCLRKKFIASLSSTKIFPSTRWLSINSFLSVPWKRAKRIVNCVYIPVSFVKSAVAAFRGLLPVVNFHFPNTSSMGSVRAKSDNRPLSTPRRTTPRISFSSNELISVNSDGCLSHANMSGLLLRNRSSYMSRGISFVVLSTL